MTTANVMSLTMQADAGGPKLADGAYFAAYRGNEPTPAREFEGKMLEPGIRWAFEVSKGPHQGRKLGPITGTVPTPKNACGRTLCGVLGRTPAAGETPDLAECVGREYLVTVAGGKVAAITLPPQT